MICTEWMRNTAMRGTKPNVWGVKLDANYTKFMLESFNGNILQVTRFC